MRRGTAVWLAVLAVVLVPASAGAGTIAAPTGPALALTATPSRLALVGAGTATVRVGNTGSRAIGVDVARAGFALDLRGRPRVIRRTGPRAATAWLRVHPPRLVVPPGSSRLVTVSARVPGGVAPGDHDALVILATRPEQGARVAVRMRIGVVVVVRAPGRVVRRLAVGALRSRRVGAVTRIEVSVANRGNVAERLARGRVRVVLRRGATAVVLRAGARELRPRTTGVLELAYRGRVRGWVTARVDVAPDRGRPAVRRIVRIKL